jgi:tRNA modification GTPase
VYKDTIAAISTPVGQGGIGIVRLSGEEALPIAQRLFPGRLEDRRLTHGHIVDPKTGDTVDEVLVSYMAAPHSYTREDVVEINCHSGPLVLQRILGIVLNCGARLANPGEFTLRAFLNGRIDLAQAEAVLDVIQAKTEAGLQVAVGGLGGRLSKAVGSIRTELVSTLAYVTAALDFPDDDINGGDVFASIQDSLARVRVLIDTADNGIVYRQGVRTAIVGRPNVGKSSILNRLLREDRAIVTPVPGTTRDTIEEIVNLQGVPFVLVDTAGLTRSSDLVESLGVERSRRAIREADFVLAVIDVSAPITQADEEIIASVGEKKCLIVANKADLPQQADVGKLQGEIALSSALTGQGIAELEERMVGAVLGGEAAPPDELLVTNPRHKDALIRAADSLEDAVSAINSGMPEDLVAIDIENAVSALGEITGQTLREELLDTIFSQFCIGK